MPLHPHSLYNCCGCDFTITSPKGYVPPFQHSRANKKPALADKHLITKERLKLVMAGACDPNTNISLTGKDTYSRLLDADSVLQPVAISPHGKWGAIFQNHCLSRMGGDH